MKGTSTTRMRIAVSTVCVLASFPLVAAETASEVCGKLAASTFDHNRKTPGVPYDQLDAQAAIPACAEAHKLLPDDSSIQFQYARSLQKGGQYEKAFELYRDLAERGDPLAQNSLGDMHLYGLGVPQSDTEAVKWYRKSAELGLAVAQDQLGSMYYAGRGVPQSDTEAVKWYKAADSQGYANAQSNIGFMYYYGKGVARNLTSAGNYFMLAAEKGNANAQNNVGIMIEHGINGRPNIYRAIEWYRKAADQGHMVAQGNLDRIKKAEESLSKRDIAAAERYRKEAEQGDGEAAYNLGMSYFDGRGVLKDPSLARRWLGRAAMNGYRPAGKILARMNANEREPYRALGAAKTGISAEQVLIGVIIGGALLSALNSSSHASSDDLSYWRESERIDQRSLDRAEDDFNRLLLFGDPMGGHSFGFGGR
jgi:TPR repeat protein